MAEKTPLRILNEPAVDSAQAGSFFRYSGVKPEKTVSGMHIRGKFNAKETAATTSEEEEVYELADSRTAAVFWSEIGKFKDPFSFNFTQADVDVLFGLDEEKRHTERISYVRRNDVRIRDCLVSFDGKPMFRIIISPEFNDIIRTHVDCDEKTIAGTIIITPLGRANFRFCVPIGYDQQDKVYFGSPCFRYSNAVTTGIPGQMPADLVQETCSTAYDIWHAIQTAYDMGLDDFVAQFVG